MPLKNWSTNAGDNSSTPPYGAPEGATSVGSFTDIIRQIMADVRTLASMDSIASAATCDIGSKDSTFLTVTGTTNISSFGTVSAGIWKVLVFSGALTISHNATSLILPGGANITTAANDIMLMLSHGGGNWRCLFYQKAEGYQPLRAEGYQPLSTLLSALGSLDASTGLVEQTGSTTFTKRSIGVSSSTSLPTRSDTDTRYVRKDTSESLSYGYTIQTTDLGTTSTVGTYTPDPSDGAAQLLHNNSSWTFNAPTQGTNICLLVVNQSGAQVPTISGFDKVTGSFTTTSGHAFMCYITALVEEGSTVYSHLHIQALQ